jgi:hypothetical protein
VRLSFLPVESQPQQFKPKKKKKKKERERGCYKKKKANAVTIARILCDFFMVKFYFKFVFFSFFLCAHFISP